MWTATSHPPPPSEKKEKSKKEKRKSHKKDRNEPRSEEHEIAKEAPREVAINPPQLNGISKKDKSKKRHHVEIDGEAEATAAAEREESPKKKKKKDKREKKSESYQADQSPLDKSQRAIPPKSSATSSSKQKAVTEPTTNGAPLSTAEIKKLQKAKKKKKKLQREALDDEQEEQAIAPKAPIVKQVVLQEPATPSKTDKKKEKSKEKKKDRKRRLDQVEDTPDAAELDAVLEARTSPSKRARTDVASTKSTPSKVRFSVPQQQPMEGLESPFFNIRASFKVAIPPVAQAYPLEGVLAHYASPLLLTYHPQMNGVLLAYNNAHLNTSPPTGSDGQDTENRDILAKSVDEYATPFVWLAADFLIFRPKKGITLQGHVNMQNESHISLMLWNLFTVTLEKKFLPKDWYWHDYYTEYDEADGHGEKPMRRANETWGSWCDGEGHEIQGALRFTVRDWDCAPPGNNGEGSFLSVEGSMLTDEDEKALEREEAEAGRKEAANRSNRRGATSLISAMRRSGTPATGDGSEAEPATAGASRSGAKKGKKK